MPHCEQRLGIGYGKGRAYGLPGKKLAKVERLELSPRPLPLATSLLSNVLLVCPVRFNCN